MEPGAVESEARRLAMAFASFVLLSSLFMGLRVYCKYRYGKKLALDDYLMSVAWVRTY